MSEEKKPEAKSKDEGSFPEESKDTVYQRDKTAKEPRVKAKEGEEGQDAAKPPPKKPVIKPRKVFVPKKVKIKTDKPMEHRTRHILVSTLDTANLLKQTVVEFQDELAAQPVDDPDKVYQDFEKTEKFFKRLAKKYSMCITKQIGGEIGWIRKNMDVPEIITQEVVDAALKLEKFTLEEPVKTKLGYHILLVCESQICKTQEEEKKDDVDPRYQALVDQDRPRAQAPPKSMDIPT